MPVVGGVLGSRGRIAAGLGVAVGAVQERMLAALGAPLGAASRWPTRRARRSRRVTRPRRAADPVVLRARDRAVHHGRGDRRPRRDDGRRRGEPLDRAAEAARRRPRDGRDRPQPPPRRARPPRGGARRDAADRGHDRQPPRRAAGLVPVPRPRRRRALSTPAACSASRSRSPATAAGLAVPAHCEIVLEGRLDHAEQVDEGLVSEFHGMYEDYGERARS